jgi:GH24 family phage-related lysozyme (muramidase)
VAFAQKFGQTIVQGIGIAPGFQATHASVVNSFVPWSTPFEGYIDYPYTDAHGLVTTGMGNLIDALSAGQVMGQNCGHGTSTPCGQSTPTATARALPWQGGSIDADWAAIKSAWPGVSSTGDKAITSCRLPREAVENLIHSKMAQNEAFLVANLPGYADAPADAQLATHSMSWAMGPGFAKTWTGFRSAFANKDYATAAAQSHMKGVGIDMRNKANKLLLMNADTITKKNLDKDKLLYLDGLGITTAVAAGIGLGTILLLIGGVVVFVYRKQIFGA